MDEKRIFSCLHLMSCHFISLGFTSIHSRCNKLTSLFWFRLHILFVVKDFPFKCWLFWIVNSFKICSYSFLYCLSFNWDLAITVFPIVFILRKLKVRTFHQCMVFIFNFYWTSWRCKASLGLAYL